MARRARCRVAPRLPKRALHLKFEEAAGPQQPVDLASIAVNDLAARNVLKNDIRKSEVYPYIPQNLQIGPAVLKQVNIGPVGERFFGLAIISPLTSTA